MGQIFYNYFGSEKKTVKVQIRTELLSVFLIKS